MHEGQTNKVKKEWGNCVCVRKRERERETHMEVDFL